MATSSFKYRYTSKWLSWRTDPVINSPSGIAVDSLGNCYIINTNEHEILKYDSKNRLVRRWGKQGIKEGEFHFPTAIAIDSSDYIYISDTNNHRIQKFDCNGNWLTSWGKKGVSAGEFQYPQGVAVDDQNQVYVVDPYNYRIQRFTENGRFIDEYGSYCKLDLTSDKSSPGFLSPFGIAIDSKHIFVTDTKNRRVSKFDRNWNVLKHWGRVEEKPFDADTYDFYEKPESGELKSPTGIALDVEGHVWVIDKERNDIQKFDLDGHLIDTIALSIWGSYNEIAIRYPKSPHSICKTIEGNMMVSDTAKNRISIFDRQGYLLSYLGKAEDEIDEYDLLKSLVLDKEDHIYVNMSNAAKVVKLDTNGNLICKVDTYKLFGDIDDTEYRESLFGLNVDKDGENLLVSFQDPRSNHSKVCKIKADGSEILSFVTSKASHYRSSDYRESILVDSNGNYLINSHNNRLATIQRYSVEGVLINKWITAAQKKISRPTKQEMCVFDQMAMNSMDVIYGVCSQTHQVIAYSVDGEFIGNWQGEGSGQGQFSFPWGIAIDKDDYIYIVDSDNHRIQIFDRDMNYLSEVSVGTPEYGNLEYPRSLAIDSQGNMYVMNMDVIYKYERVNE
ncbi:hypothetical protein [Paenibacillus sp. YIM B09110]|uniref:hypothetical protein n=1 Tax=Paenibacillus sp. YIM B09110 TaxID=3126102 RepID=UPI00301E5F25